jgi:hypothetical protein
LESEREELRKNLKLAESKTNLKKDEHKTDMLATLLSGKGKEIFRKKLLCKVPSNL